MMVTNPNMMTYVAAHEPQKAVSVRPIISIPSLIRFSFSFTTPATSRGEVTQGRYVCQGWSKSGALGQFEEGNGEDETKNDGKCPCQEPRSVIVDLIRLQSGVPKKYQNQRAHGGSTF